MPGAIAGVTYASPFAGRVGDISHDEMQPIEHIVQMSDHFNITMQVNAAGMRHPPHSAAARMAYPGR